MGTLLDKARAMAAAISWEPKEVNDGIDGVVVAIKRFKGHKFETTKYFLETEEGTKVVSVNSETVLASNVDDVKPRVGDKLAILYLGIPPGKSYKNWEVLCQHQAATDGDKSSDDPKPEGGNPDGNDTDDIPF
jgi:hypothetical protein